MLKKSLEMSRSVSIGPLLSKYDWMGASHSVLQPPIYFGLKYIFLAFINLFDITYLSKCSRIDTSGWGMNSGAPFHKV